MSHVCLSLTSCVGWPACCWCVASAPSLCSLRAPPSVMARSRLPLVLVALAFFGLSAFLLLSAPDDEYAEGPSSSSAHPCPYADALGLDADTPNPHGHSMPSVHDIKQQKADAAAAIDAATADTTAYQHAVPAHTLDTAVISATAAHASHTSTDSSSSRHTASSSTGATSSSSSINSAPAARVVVDATGGAPPAAPRESRPDHHEQQELLRDEL